MWKFNSVIFVILLSYILSVNASYLYKKTFKKCGDKLIFAHVIFRHGERNPSQSFPNDPYNNQSLWRFGWGALTIKGRKQAYKLGKYLRKRYINFVNHGYSPNDVYIRSTDVDRVLMTGAVMLSALYPPTKDETWDDDLAWQPIPIHTVPVPEDYLLINQTPCPEFDDIFAVYMENSTLGQQINAKVAAQKAYLSQKSGNNIQTVMDVFLLYDTIHVEQIQNKQLQPWQIDILKPGDVYDIAQFFFFQDSETPKLARISSGFLLKEMLQHFEQKINSTLSPNRSLWFYGAHDWTIANFLNSLRIPKIEAPGFASSVYVELYNSKKIGNYVQVSYKNTGDDVPVVQKIPNCGKKCPLDQFTQLYANIMPGDHATECALTSK